MRIIALLLLPLVVVACETETEGGLPLDCVSFTEQGLQIEDYTRASLLGGLGVPDTVEWTTVRSAGNEDSLFVVRYPGLAVSLHKPTGGTEVVDQVRVTDNMYLRYPGAGIGATADELKSALGDSAIIEDGDQIIVSCHSHPANDNPVAFRMRADSVVEIIYTYYMD